VLNSVANSATGAVVGAPSGYTGHKQLDDIGLTPMNGRIVDPTLGVFNAGRRLASLPADKKVHPIQPRFFGA